MAIVFPPVLRCLYLFVLLDADLAPACTTIVLLQSQPCAPPQLLMLSAGAHVQMPLLSLAGPKLTNPRACPAWKELRALLNLERYWQWESGTCECGMEQTAKGISTVRGHALLASWSNIRAAGIKVHQWKQVEGDSGAFVSSITTFVRSSGLSDHWQVWWVKGCSSGKYAGSFFWWQADSTQPVSTKYCSHLPLLTIAHLPP